MREIIRLAKGLQFGPTKVGRLLGCGDYGCVFSTSQQGVVVKIGTQWSEYKFAKKIVQDQLDHPGLPQIYGVIDLRAAVEVPYYAVIREDIPNLAVLDIEWFNEVLADLEHAVDEEDDSDYVFEEAVKILEARPGAPQDELYFEQVAELTAWCLERRILLGDTLAANFGIKDGQIKWRDLGGVRLF